eukprot:1400629-Pleurochrysis_carterae.AAC.1
MRRGKEGEGALEFKIRLDTLERLSLHCPAFLFTSVMLSSVLKSALSCVHATRLHASPSHRRRIAAALASERQPPNFMVACSNA